MPDMIFAYEAVRGQLYRLFPNGKRSRYIVAKALGISPKGHPLFLFDDPDSKVSILLTNVDNFERIQEVSSVILENMN